MLINLVASLEGKIMIHPKCLTQTLRQDWSMCVTVFCWISHTTTVPTLTPMQTQAPSLTSHPTPCFFTLEVQYTEPLLCHSYSCMKVSMIKHWSQDCIGLRSLNQYMQLLWQHSTVCCHIIRYWILQNSTCRPNPLCLACRVIWEMQQISFSQDYKRM